MKITLEREPDYFLAERREATLRCHTVVARLPTGNTVGGMAARAVHEVFLDGAPARIGYLTQLRISPEWRRRVRPFTRQGFEWLETTRNPDETPFDFTTIVEDNQRALRLLRAGLPGLPAYRELGRIRTLLFPVPPSPDKSLHEHPATVVSGRRVPRNEWLSCLERFARRHQFAKRWTEETLAQTGLSSDDFLCIPEPGGDGQPRVRGCAAVWNQSGFKQIVIHGAGARQLEAAGNGGKTSQPHPPGNAYALPCVYLSHIAVDNDDPGVFRSLLQVALQKARDTHRAQWMLLGLAANHPLLEVARRFHPAEFGSILFAVHPQTTKVQLDERIPHVEIACL